MRSSAATGSSNLEQQYGSSPTSKGPISRAHAMPAGVTKIPRSAAVKISLWTASSRTLTESQEQAGGHTKLMPTLQVHRSSKTYQVWISACPVFDRRSPTQYSTSSRTRQNPHHSHMTARVLRETIDMAQAMANRAEYDVRFWWDFRDQDSMRRESGYGIVLIFQSGIYSTAARAENTNNENTKDAAIDHRFLFLSVYRKTL